MLKMINTEFYKDGFYELTQDGYISIDNGGGSLMDKGDLFEIINGKIFIVKIRGKVINKSNDYYTHVSETTQLKYLGTQKDIKKDM